MRYVCVSGTTINTRSGGRSTPAPSAGSVSTASMSSGDPSAPERQQLVDDPLHRDLRRPPCRCAQLAVVADKDRLVGRSQALRIDDHLDALLPLASDDL